MAKLTIQLNGTAGSVNTPDAKATKLLDLYIQARYVLYPLMRAGEVESIPLAELSTVQRMDWIAADVVRYISEVARGRRKALARQTADEAVREEVATLDWRA